MVKSVLYVGAATASGVFLDLSVLVASGLALGTIALALTVATRR